MKKAGRPAMPESEKRKARSFKATDYEWGVIQKRAEAVGLSASEFIRLKTLGGCQNARGSLWTV